MTKPGAPLELDFRAIDEPDPGPKWAALFEEYWPAYRGWYLCEGPAARPRYAECAQMIERHLPAFVPTWERLVDLAGGGDLAARFLSLWRPPPLVTGCSQALWVHGDEIALVRNYDYAPQLCDGVILASAWTGRRVLALTDCLIGALDGMNEDGLAAALAFGGRRVVGEGFGTPLLVRWLLETCATTDDAVAALRGAHVHMSYNVALIDASGALATVHLAPDRPVAVTTAAVSTNHQGAVDWPRYARFTETERRQDALQACLSTPDTTLAALSARFLQPPLRRTAWDRGSGTLYTAIYRPRAGTVELRWPDHAWTLSLDDFREGVHVARYTTTADPGA